MACLVAKENWQSKLSLTITKEEDNWSKYELILSDSIKKKKQIQKHFLKLNWIYTLDINKEYTLIVSLLNFS